MNLNRYQEIASGTAIYPEAGSHSDNAVNYTILGLTGESSELLKLIHGLAGDSGHLANIWKKAYRDGDYTIIREQIRYELGDVLWYVAALANELGMTLDQVALTNIEKLRDRRVRNQLQGSGDDR